MASEGSGMLRSRSTSRIRKPSEATDESDWGRRRLEGRRGTYEGEDTSPTTAREIWGWYCYGLAAEIFAVCGVGESEILLSAMPEPRDFVVQPRGIIEQRAMRIYESPVDDFGQE